MAHNDQPPHSETRSHQTTALDHTHLLVLAGGNGRRLMRLSAATEGGRPKQFCRFGLSRSFLQQTIDRSVGLVAPERICVISSQAQRELAERDLRPYAKARLVLQPADRGTGMALLLALLDVQSRDRDAVVVVTPADHGFLDDAALCHALATAQTVVAGDPRTILLFGATPNEPRSDYGWIIPDHFPAAGSCARVVAFEEKPERTRAEELLAAGGLWSTLILVARVDALVLAFARRAPQALMALLPCVLAPPWRRSRRLARAYQRLAPLDLSRDVLTHAQDLWVQRLDASVGWTDLGDEDRLAAWLATRVEGPRTAGLHLASGTPELSASHQADVA
jgi:mannose-1-phosphate guanylyltransferase